MSRLNGDHRLFIFNDRAPSVSGAREATKEQALDWNTRGYGVFWVINDFVGDRLVSNLTKVNAWFFEIDHIPKAQQLAVIEQGLYPSFIVESKNSFHVYFLRKEDSADGLSSFGDIQQRLIQFYGSDEKIKDPLRLMRAPGYYHMKDMNDPFMVKTVWESNIGGKMVEYSENAMRYFYPPLPDKENPTPTRFSHIDVSDKNMEYFNTLYNLDHLKVLEAFSGTRWVGGETYQFRDNRNGKFNIDVNGKSTHCFIDQDGRIGAVNGGPTIWQWLKYFNHNPSQIREAIKEVLSIC